MCDWDNYRLEGKPEEEISGKKEQGMKGIFFN